MDDLSNEWMGERKDEWERTSGRKDGWINGQT